VTDGRTAFVLGGGGHRGAYEVGMLKALTEHGIEPDLIVGTSIGAINGAIYASSPDSGGIATLEAAWRDLSFSDLFPGTVWSRARSAIQQRTYLHANDHLRSWLADHLDDRDIEGLPVSFQCVAACIEDSSEHWFSSGPLVDALLASSAVPGLLPPVEAGGRHYIDGGVVNSIPLSRALELGATRVFVLHVGHIDDELAVPTRPWDVGVVAFEIARRHRFASDLAHVPTGVDVHVLPTGARPGRFNDPTKLRYGDLSKAEQHIASAYRASDELLESIDIR
jgi:NTE family protein